MQQPTLLNNRILGRLVRAFAPERIIVFGSYAKGTAHAGSDIDVLIVADLQGDPVTNLRRARQLVSDSFPLVDISFCTPEEMDAADRASSPFLLSILGKGVTVYSHPHRIPFVSDEPPPT
jgi:predicted nucleotidyltransferase